MFLRILVLFNLLFSYIEGIKLLKKATMKASKVGSSLAKKATKAGKSAAAKAKSKAKGLKDKFKSKRKKEMMNDNNMYEETSSKKREDREIQEEPEDVINIDEDGDLNENGEGADVPSEKFRGFLINTLTKLGRN